MVFVQPEASPAEGGGLRVNRNLTIPESELSWRFTGSGGPGGQHANTANTKVDLRFDIGGSEVLGPRQRQRLAERFGGEVRVVESGRRSQLRNREEARRRLAALIAEALRVERPRKATRPGRGAVERRLREKQRRGERKRERRRSDWD